MGEMTIHSQLLKSLILIWIILSLMTGCQLFTSTSSKVPATVPSVQTPAGSTLQPTRVSETPVVPIRPQLAWFYHPTSSDQLINLAQSYQFFILTKGDEEQRDELITMGLGESPVLQYLRFDAIQDPGDCISRPRRNQVAYSPGDFCEISQNHPDWFLLDAAGNRFGHNSNGQLYYQMDPGNAGWREFFLSRVKESQADPAWSGVFLDNVDVSLNRLEDWANGLQRYPSDETLRAAVSGFLTFLNEHYFDASPKVLFANIVGRRVETDWLVYFPLVDGGMHEGWSIASTDHYEPPKVWEQQMEVAEQAQWMGKTIILVTQGRQDNLEQQRFTYASYLLINQGLAYFRYAGSNHYNEIWLYPDYELELGQPLGPRYQDGDVWRRDFKHGSVMVNPVTHESEITVR